MTLRVLLCWLGVSLWTFSLVVSACRFFCGYSYAPTYHLVPVLLPPVQRHSILFYYFRLRFGFAQRLVVRRCSAEL